jgi:S1-C subfamily serine protease
VRHFGLARESGVRVESVERGSPAADAGLEKGDLIVTLDGLPMVDVDALQRQLAAGAIGRPLALNVVRRNRSLDLVVTPRETPLRAR